MPFVNPEGKYQREMPGLNEILDHMDKLLKPLRNDPANCSNYKSAIIGLRGYSDNINLVNAVQTRMSEADGIHRKALGDTPHSQGCPAGPAEEPGQEIG